MTITDQNLIQALKLGLITFPQFLELWVHGEFKTFKQKGLK